MGGPCGSKEPARNQNKAGMKNILAGWYRRYFLAIILLCGILPAVYAQNSEKTSSWRDLFYIEGVANYNFPFLLFDGVAESNIGFRGVIGVITPQRLRFSLSAGYSQASGTDPLLETFTFIPLTARAGYALPLKSNWGLQADLGMGVQFSNISYYKTKVDYLKEQKSELSETKPFAEARVYATYALPVKFLNLYAGGGTDLIFETDGPIPLLVAEVGISLKPFAIPVKPRPAKPVLKPLTNTTIQERVVEVQQEPQIVYMEPEPEPEPQIVYTEPEPKLEPKPEPQPVYLEPETKPVLFEYAIYFEADRGTKVIRQSVPLLREAGRRLKENPQTSVTLRGYAAPTGTAEGQITISAARVWYCVEYLKYDCGIAENRIHMQFYGAPEEMSLSEDVLLQMRRRVELIIEQESVK